MKTPPSPPRSEPQSTEDLIRNIAYFHWLDSGCPPDNDWAHWFAAKEILLDLETSLVPDRPSNPAPPSFSIRATVASHQSDPTHRFHNPAAAHDSRTDVIAGSARQRVRARSPGGGRSRVKQAN